MVKGSKASDEVWVTRKEMGRLLGVTGVSIDNYREKIAPPIPHDKSGTNTTYPSSACVKWFVNYQLELAAKRDTGSTKTSISVGRLKAAQAGLAELELAREKEITVTIEEAGTRMNRIAEAFVEALTSLPGKSAPDFVGLADEITAQVALDQMTKKVRSELVELYGLEEKDD